MKRRLTVLFIILCPFLYGQSSEEYFYKALDLESKGLLNEAVQMFTKALESAPGSHEIYNNRGIVYRKLKKYDLAIMDYTMAIKIKPDLVFSYNNRAIAYYFIADYKNATADYETAISCGRGEGFYYFLHLIASYKVSKEAYQRSFALLNKDKEFIKDRWAQSISDFFTGKIKAKALLDKSGYDPDRLCEAYFYIGFKSMFAGRKFKARSYFKKCVKTGKTDFIEYEYAQLELRKK